MSLRKAYRETITKTRLQAEVSTLRKKVAWLHRAGARNQQAGSLLRKKEQDFARALNQRDRAVHDVLDGIVQSLFAAGLSLEATRLLMGTDSQQAALELQHSATHLNEIIEKVRAFLVGPSHRPA